MPTPLASIFTPVEIASDAITRMLGLDPHVGAGAALAFFIFEFVKVSVLILGISWLMALVRRGLPIDHVRRWLGTRIGRMLGYPAAAAFGAVTPFCSCSSVPLFIGFIEAGIPIGVTFAFLITSPLVNEIVVALFIASFGWKVATLYTGCGIVLGILGGLTMQALGSERWLSSFARNLREPADRAQSAVEEPCCCCKAPAEKPSLAHAPSRISCAPLVFKPSAPGGAVTGMFIPLAPASAAPCCGASEQPETAADAEEPCGCAVPRTRAPQSAVQFATSEAWDIYRQILVYLTLALLIGAGIHGYLPDGFFVDFFNHRAWWHVPAATAIGMPLYASANATVPILETLVAKGVPLGTGMALIMSAVGVSLPELVLLKRVMTVRLLALFTGVVCAGVIVVGYLFNALPAGW